MSTVADVADQIVRNLRGVSGRDRATALNGAVSTADLQATIDADVSDLVVAGTGATLEVGFEIMQVVAASTNLLTVSRAEDGTTAALHADNSKVTVEPRWPRQLVADEMRHEVESWPEDLWEVQTAALAWPADSRAVDSGLSISGNQRAYRILGAERAHTSAAKYGYKQPELRLIRNISDATFTSGYAVQTVGPIVYGEAVTVDVVYAVSFDTDTWATSTELDGAGGVFVDAPNPRQLLDILVWGTGARMLRWRAAGRVDLDRQGQSRHPDEVPPDMLVGTAREWERVRDRRIKEEVARLHDQYPPEFG